jgi:hypothetical protein
MPPSPRQILADITDLGLDPTKPYGHTGDSGRISKSDDDPETPFDIFGDILVSWLRADDNPLGAASWPNRVISQSAFILNGTPPVAAAVAPLPGLLFAGTGFYEASSLAVPITAGQRPSVFHVWSKSDSVQDGAYQGIGLVQSANEHEQIYQMLFGTTNTNWNQVNEEDNGGGYIFSPSIVLNRTYVQAVQFSKFETRVTAPGITIPAETWSGIDGVTSASLDYAALGRNPTFGVGFVGVIAEQIILSALPSTHQRAKLYHYFYNRYGTLQS